MFGIIKTAVLALSVALAANAAAITDFDGNWKYNVLATPYQTCIPDAVGGYVGVTFTTSGVTAVYQYKVDSFVDGATSYLKLSSCTASLSGAATTCTTASYPETACLALAPNGTNVLIGTPTAIPADGNCASSAISNGMPSTTACAAPSSPSTSASVATASAAVIALLAVVAGLSRRE